MVSNLKSESNWLNKGKFLSHITEKPRGRSGFRRGGIPESNINRDPVFSRLSPWPPKGDPTSDPTSDLLQPVIHLPTVSETPASSSTYREIKNISFPNHQSFIRTALFRSETLLNPCGPGEPCTEWFGERFYCFMNQSPCDLCSQRGLGLYEFKQHGHEVLGRGKWISVRQPHFTNFLL